MIGDRRFLPVITVLDMSKISNIIDFDAYFVFVQHQIFKITLNLTAVKIYQINIFLNCFCINLLINLSPNQNY